MKSPTLSVTMACYNHGHYVKEALDALLSQSFKPTEIIVVDDFSNDNSAEVIQEFVKRDSTIRLIRNNKNMGAVLAANRARKMCSGDYIYGAAADDRVLPELFERSISILEKFPKAGLCSSTSRLIDEYGNDKGSFLSPIIKNRDSFIEPEQIIQLLKEHGSWFVGNATIYRREALIESGGHIPDLGPFCDGFIQQVIALRYGACFIPEPLACWRQMESGYATSTLSNIERSFEIMTYAEELMRTKYRDLFPPVYVIKWKRDWLYGMGVTAGNNLQRSQDTYRSHIAQSILLQNAMDRPFLVGLKCLARFQNLIVKIYLFLRFGQFTWQNIKQHFQIPLKNI
jgi:glycosyltransferase involved in cell wall biosynthesis